MDIAIENVTPKKAENWLDKNPSNRALREGVAEKYADDMRNLRWTSCPVPISFYDDGELADGQHRLWAIVESGMSQSFPVARGLERKDGLNLDTGLTRSLVDNGRISGEDTGLSASLIGAVRGVAQGHAQSGSMSNAAKLALVAEHREAAQWAVTNVRHVRYLCNAVIIASVARAWYLEPDKEKLARFCDVMGTGFSEGDTETAAIAIRNYLLGKGSQSSNAANWRDTFLKVQNAVHYFMRGKKLVAIKSISEEAYPLKKSRAKK